MRKEKLFAALPVCVCCGVMLMVDGLWQPGYWIKSGCKIALFLAVPLGYGLLWGDFFWKSLFRGSRKGLLRAAALGAAVYAVILGAYFALQGAVDFSGVLENLPEGVTKATFPLVALYISFVNSLLEEFFFRGFAYLTLEKRIPHASLFSAVAFAVYHTAMMLGWFPPAIFALALAGLTVGGMIFNWLNKYDGSIYTSWLVHMCANFAINTVGFILFARAA